MRRTIMTVLMALICRKAAMTLRDIQYHGLAVWWDLKKRECRLRRSHRSALTGVDLTGHRFMEAGLLHRPLSGMANNHYRHRRPRPDLLAIENPYETDYSRLRLRSSCATFSPPPSSGLRAGNR